MVISLICCSSIGGSAAPALVKTKPFATRILPTARQLSLKVTGFFAVSERLLGARISYETAQGKAWIRCLSHISFVASSLQSSQLQRSAAFHRRTIRVSAKVASNYVMQQFPTA